MNVRECVLNVQVEDPLEALELRVFLVLAPHLLREAGERLGTDGAVTRALGRVSRSLSSIHVLDVGDRDTRASDEEPELGLEVITVPRVVTLLLVHVFSAFHVVGEVGLVRVGGPQNSLLRDLGASI